MTKDACEYGSYLTEVIKVGTDDSLSLLLGEVDLIIMMGQIGAFQINALCWGILKKKKCQHWIATLTAIRQIAGEDDVKSNMALSVLHWDTDIEAVKYSGKLQEVMAGYMERQDIEYVELGPN